MSAHGTTQTYDAGCRCAACVHAHYRRTVDAAFARMSAVLAALLPPAQPEPEPEPDPVSSGEAAVTPPPPLIFTEGDQTFETKDDDR